jgi:hypothetical protein
VRYPNSAQRLLRLFRSNARVLFPRTILLPKIVGARSTIGRKNDDRVADSLQQRATCRGLVIRMGDEHERASEQWAQRVHRT